MNRKRFDEYTDRVTCHIEKKVSDDGWTLNDVVLYLDIEIEKLNSEKKRFKEALKRVKDYNDEQISSDILRKLQEISKESWTEIELRETIIRFFKMLQLGAQRMLKLIKRDGQYTSIQPINWLKSKELLRQFIESLKRQKLIKERETEDIINEHFRVDKIKPTKEPQPIVWLAQIMLLPYLMDQLSQERFIEVKGAKHKLTASHFVNESGDPLDRSSLGSMLSKLKKEVKQQKQLDLDCYVVKPITTVINTISDNN